MESFIFVFESLLSKNYLFVDDWTWRLWAHSAVGWVQWTLMNQVGRKFVKFEHRNF